MNLIDKDKIVQDFGRFLAFLRVADNEYLKGYAGGLKAAKSLVEETTNESPTERTALAGCAVTYCKDCTKRGLSLCPIGLVGDMDYCSKAREKGQGL